MLNSKSSTRMPAHSGQPLNFEVDSGLRMGSRLPESFNYIAPVCKYSPAMFQPGPVYRGGEAASIGKQPWNFSQVWTAYSTPSQMSWAYGPSYKGTQSTASYAVSQQAMANLLAMRSINAGRG